jgi:hypothetical protein
MFEILGRKFDMTLKMFLMHKIHNQFLPVVEAVVEEG